MTTHLKKRSKLRKKIRFLEKQLAILSKNPSVLPTERRHGYKR